MRFDKVQALRLLMYRAYSVLRNITFTAVRTRLQQRHRIEAWLEAKRLRAEAMKKANVAGLNPTSVMFSSPSGNWRSAQGTGEANDVLYRSVLRASTALIIGMATSRVHYPRFVALSPSRARALAFVEKHNEECGLIPFQSRRVLPALPFQSRRVLQPAFRDIGAESVTLR